jgi:hypothetical protein
MMVLFRPVGLYELALIWDSGMREFPPRLHHQPIFYPVVIPEYATQIARDWNAKDSASGFAGYITRFTVLDTFLARYELHTVGSATHVEYWIPAEQLQEFNASIQEKISLESGFFSSGFTGFIPAKFGLRGQEAVTQFVTMAKTWGYSRMDFVCEVSANRKAFYLNFLFWAQCDFAEFGISRQERDVVIEALRKAWDFNHIEIPLPEVSPT